MYARIRVEKEIGMEKSSLANFIETFLPYQIAYTANYNKSFRREFQAKCISDDVGADEFAILMLIDMEPEISQTDIAKYLFKGKAHVGKILNEMEEKGFIKRIVDSKNNIMIKKNVLTEKACEYLKFGKSKTVVIRERMDKEFTQAERELFIEYLKRFRSVLSSLVDVKLK